ncbi:MAG: hypothetical protein NTV23_00420 [Propionibacteriales bacterium]|nr:hypothetical protein [Propionibacteriales bacterium]
MTTRSWLGAVALVAGAALTGCGGSGSPTVATPSTGSAPSSAVPSVGSSGTPVGTPGAGPVDGLAPATDVRSLPAGFPVKQIPVVPGVLVGASQGGTDDPFAFTVLVRVAGASPAAAMKRIDAQLTRAGFTAAPGVSTPTTSTSTFSNARYDVGVNVIRADGTNTATYVVVRRTG